MPFFGIWISSSSRGSRARYDQPSGEWDTPTFRAGDEVVTKCSAFVVVVLVADEVVR